jgi:hypothetical protein
MNCGRAPIIVTIFFMRFAQPFDVPGRPAVRRRTERD